MQPLISIALAVALTVFIYAYTLSYAQLVVRRLVESKHRDAEAIIETGKAPTHAILDYIELFYNRTRLHSTLEYRSPLEYDKADAQRAA